MSLHDAHREPTKTLGGTFEAHVILRWGQMSGLCMLIRQAAIGNLSYALVRRHNGARREKSEEDKYRDGPVMKV